MGSKIILTAKLLCVILSIVVHSNADPWIKEDSEVPALEPSSKCSDKGACVNSDDCLDVYENYSCSSELHPNAVCCKEVRPTSCANGATCMTWCASFLRRESTMCGENQFCCVLTL